MRVLIATDGYRYNLGGVATSVLALSAGLRGCGHEVRVLALSNCHRSFRDGDDFFIRSFPALFYPDMRMSFAVRDPLLRELEAWQPDVIHIQTEGSARCLALRVQRQGHAPVVMTCHTDYGHFIFHGLKTTAPVKALMRTAGKLLYRCADRVTTPSHKAAAFPFLDAVRDRITVVPNGMEIEKYQRHFTGEARRAFRASLGIGDGTGVLVTVSRLSKEKNIQELIAYLPGLLKRVPDAKFLIVGDTNGEHMDSLTIAEKGHAHLKLVARGKGGHSSIPWVSDNPIPKLNEGYAKILAALPKPTKDEDHWRDYLTATRLVGSQANNIIPDTAEMYFSYRFIEPDGPQKMKAFIEKLTGLELVLPETWRPPVISDPSNPYISTLFEAMRRKWPDRNIRYTKMSCATDATRYVHLKLPTVIFGANGFGAHANDERVSVSSLVEYTQMFTGYLKAQFK